MKKRRRSRVIDAKELFEKCLHQASDVVRQVRADQCGLPTPDTEWTVKELLEHMFYELAWAPDIINGMTREAVGSKYEGDLLGEELHASWKALRDRALIALDHAGLRSVVHLSYGDVRLEQYLRQLASDLLIHAWDLGESVGRRVVFDEAVAGAVWEYAKSESAAMRESGLFGRPLQAGAGASTQERLLGLFGRSSDWRRKQ